MRSLCCGNKPLFELRDRRHPPETMKGYHQPQPHDAVKESTDREAEVAGPYQPKDPSLRRNQRLRLLQDTHINHNVLGSLLRN
ncbi:hypothetical protein BDA96_10G282000 [Sorghum bicolor]|uniref:Uncharacterized protein n=2 Tax=Sorghum bicolor TaxID=4558 RepID=A0A1W0VU78_SORBI|nr:hypothetical protein BDA96_10G282000 [Sorghum bicolor]OQU76820.1 hypothetical protein SORBI_3010G217466 [Sorghum bicolor]OQU76821.1 hypothetical protein SORBI_3010G217466 [Sorghum bicolor]OQU76822.1 hypothetical protein SORBI_3010G217466 [Sorghum bicolor]